MSEDNKTIHMPDIIDAELDRLLGQWAADVLIDFEQREHAIMNGVLILSDDLGYAWWRQLCDRFSFYHVSAFSS